MNLSHWAYFFRAVATNIPEPVMRCLDASFDDFNNVIVCPAKHCEESPMVQNNKELQHVCLGIKQQQQQGCGLTCVAMLILTARLQVCVPS
jgi:hypothetical protein